MIECRCQVLENPALVNTLSKLFTLYSVTSETGGTGGFVFTKKAVNTDAEKKISTQPAL